MKILQVQFKNRNGHTLRGIVTLPDTEGKVPFVACSSPKYTTSPFTAAIWSGAVSTTSMTR